MVDLVFKTHTQQFVLSWDPCRKSTFGEIPVFFNPEMRKTMGSFFYVKGVKLNPRKSSNSSYFQEGSQLELRLSHWGTRVCEPGQDQVHFDKCVHRYTSRRLRKTWIRYPGDLHGWKQLEQLMAAMVQWKLPGNLDGQCCWKSKLFPSIILQADCDHRGYLVHFAGHSIMQQCRFTALCKGIYSTVIPGKLSVNMTTFKRPL